MRQLKRMLHVSLDLATDLDLIGEATELSLADLKVYEELGPSEPPTVDKVALRHHRIADLLASGRSNREVAYLCGVHPQTVQHLTRNAAFRELVEAARRELVDTDKILSGQLQELAVDGLAALQQQVRDGDITGDTLRKVTEGALDRVGLGPTKRIEKRSLHVNVDTIRRVRETVQKEEAADFSSSPQRPLRQIESEATAVEWSDCERTSVRAEAEADAWEVVPGDSDRESLD